MILAQSCVTPLYIFRHRVTHDCASIIAKKTSCSHCFSHCTSLHQHSFSRMIFTLVIFYTVRNTLPEALCCLHTLGVLLDFCVMYVRQLLIATFANIWTSYRHFCSEIA